MLMERCRRRLRPLRLFLLTGRGACYKPDTHSVGEHPGGLISALVARTAIFSPSLVRGANTTAACIGVRQRDEWINSRPCIRHIQRRSNLSRTRIRLPCIGILLARSPLKFAPVRCGTVIRRRMHTQLQISPQIPRLKRKSAAYKTLALSAYHEDNGAASSVIFLLLHFFALYSFLCPFSHCTNPWAFTQSRMLMHGITFCNLQHSFHTIDKSFKLH